MLRLALAVAVSAVLAFPAVALAKGKVAFDDTVPSGASSSVTLTVRAPASFRVVLRAPTQGRAKLTATARAAASTPAPGS